MTPLPFHVFELERWQSAYENTVSFNLADSTVEPLTLGQLLSVAGTDLASVSEVPLYYPEVFGQQRLRELIAALYPGVDPDADDVLVTVGASEANAILVETICQPGDHVLVMEPSYRQVSGLAQNRGCEVEAFNLSAEDWSVDLAELERLIRPSTRLIYVCNPNNPTGSILPQPVMMQIIALADTCGAWVLSDEVYQHSEHSGVVTPSLLGTSERVVVVNSLSKSYGLSGLRVGWVVGPTSLIQQLWRRHEYNVIASGRLDNALAELALAEPARGKLIERNLAAVARGWALLEPWLAEMAPHVTVVRPEATALAFLRYTGSATSVEVGQRLRQEADVLVGPGEFFGAPQHVRLNFAFGVDHVKPALDAMRPVFHAIANG